MVYRDLDAVFPLLVPGWEGNVAADLKSNVSADASISASYKSKIDGLLISLDEHNSNIIIDFRAAYLVFQGNPCANHEYLSRAVDRISDARVQVIRLRTKIAALIEVAKTNNVGINHDHFMRIFSDVVGVIATPQSVEVTIDAIQQARVTAQDFKEVRP
jgi:hypothetical protein